MLQTRFIRKAAAIPLVFALLAGTAAGQVDTADDAEFLIQFTNETAATLEVTQIWREDAAKSFRSALERGFGDGDGVLSEEEVQKIENATLKDLEGIENPNLRLDDVPGVLENVSITLDGLEGPIDQDAPVRLHHTMDTTFDLEEGLGEAHTLTFSPFVTGEVTVAAPEGYMIANVSGFQGSPDVQDALATGTVARGENVTVQLEPAQEEDPAQAGGNESDMGQDVEEVGGEEDQTPGPALVAVLGATAVTALLVGAGRRKE